MGVLDERFFAELTNSANKIISDAKTLIREKTGKSYGSELLQLLARVCNAMRPKQLRRMQHRQSFACREARRLL